ncbi:hypothetical protein HZA76_03275 [Candidatus Roizmanbacteria bacterium]|nr:hypothetical protein [Candidatus Roizmanbacteria bacterium]
MEVVALFLVSLLTRFVFLYFGYPSITHDEADYFLNSYLFAKTGSDIFSNKFFLTSGILNATSAIPVYLGSLIYFFTNKSVIVGRLPYAILNSLIPVLFYLILLKLTKNKTFSLIGFTVLNFSPWFSYLSSMSSIDAPTALVFYLIAIFIILSSMNPLLKYFLFITSLFFSFNSYMGIKTIFLFLIFIALLTKNIYYKNKLFFKTIVRDLLYSLIIFVTFFIITWISPVSQNFQYRLKDKILPLNTNLISKSVDTLREMSLGPILIRYFIHNKFTVTSNMFLDKYMQAFNPNILFVKGDTSSLYGTNLFGLFYLFDAIFIVLGFLFFRDLFKKNLTLIIPFILILITTPLTIGIMVDSPTISLRGYPLIISYSFFISCGVYYLLNQIIKNNKMISAIVFLLYLTGFIYFFALYRTTIRYTSGEQWHINEKRLIDKISLIKQESNKKIFVYVNDPKETLLLYLFYKNNDPKLIKQIINSGKFAIDNIYFSDQCPQLKISDSIQIMQSERCPVNQKVFKEKVFINTEIPKGSTYLLLN